MNTQEYFGAHARSDGFICAVCGAEVLAQGAGTKHRNHCPRCLCSVHLDDTLPGDRAANCNGVMRPVAVQVKKNGEWAIMHRCEKCGRLSANRIAADDDPLSLLSLALRPLCSLPFPPEHIAAYYRAEAGLPAVRAETDAIGHESSGKK